MQHLVLWAGDPKKHLTFSFSLRCLWVQHQGQLLCCLSLRAFLLSKDLWRPHRYSRVQTIWEFVKWIIFYSMTRSVLMLESVACKSFFPIPEIANLVFLWGFYWVSWNTLMLLSATVKFPPERLFFHIKPLFKGERAKRGHSMTRGFLFVSHIAY